MRRHDSSRSVFSHSDVDDIWITLGNGHGSEDQRLRVAMDQSRGVHGIAADAAGFIWGSVPGQATLRMDAETFEVVRLTDVQHILPIAEHVHAGAGRERRNWEIPRTSRVVARPGRPRHDDDPRSEQGA